MSLSKTLHDVTFFDRDAVRGRIMRCSSLKAEIEVGIGIMFGDTVAVDFHAAGKQLEDRRVCFLANLGKITAA